MTRRLDRKQLLVREEIVAPPSSPSPRACDDRSFELPPALHVATAGLYLGFVTVLCVAFATPALLIPYGVFVFFIAAFFAVPALWARMNPEESRTQALGWLEFINRGVATLTGRTGAGEAATLVLILPLLIFCWSLAVAIIAAVVR